MHTLLARELARSVCNRHSIASVHAGRCLDIRLICTHPGIGRASIDEQRVRRSRTANADIRDVGDGGVRDVEGRLAAETLDVLV